MALNTGSLNGAALNASARSTFILAVFAVLGTADVVASPSVTRYCEASLGGTANVIPVVPYQTHASAVINTASGDITALAVTTRFGLSVADGTSSVLASAQANQVATATLDGSGSLLVNDSVRRPGSAATTGSATVVPDAFCIRPASAAVSGAVQITTDAGFTQSAHASAFGSSAITVYAGYGMPSATAIAAKADISAYAKATRLANALSSGAAQVTATAQIQAYGNANIVGTCQAGAWVIKLQGSSYSTLGVANVVAAATYVFQVTSSLGGNGEMVANSVISQHVEATLGGTAVLRVETKVNNLLEGFSDPGALSEMTVNAQAVVVAPLIMHFDGSANILANATYVYRSYASVNAVATVTAVGVHEHQGVADVVTSGDVAATAHFLWAGEADVDGAGFTVEAYPALLIKARSDISADGEIVPIATRTQAAVATISGSADIADVTTVTRYGSALVECTVEVVSSPLAVGSAETRDPPERTMYRIATVRTMYRPFIDRTLRATRT